MNSRWQHIISTYAALCLALAGVVGLNPVLHVGVEHGGHGALHTHAFGNGRSVATPHEHPHPHGWNVPPPSAAPAPIRVSPGNSLTLFGLEPQDVCRLVTRWLTGLMKDAPDEPVQSGHTHHSLPQLLLSGLVEGSVEIAPLVIAPERCALTCLTPVSVTVAGELYPPAAGRGPPLFC